MARAAANSRKGSATLARTLLHEGLADELRLVVMPVLLGGGKSIFPDGGALRTYRHAPNTGSRKSWAAGDATAALH